MGSLGTAGAVRRTGSGMRRGLFACGLLVPLVVAALLSSGRAAAQTTEPPPSPGRIEGRVRDAATGKPLAAARVALAETELGTLSGEDGSFALGGVPPARYTLRATFIGYAPQERAVEVIAGEIAAAVFDLAPAVAGTLPEVDVRAARPMIDVKKTSTSRKLSAADLDEILTQSAGLDRVVEQQPGVVREGDQLHFRGGRADEHVFVVDGVKIRDPLSGESSGSEVSSRAAQEVNVMAGGFGARYSQAMSGVVETRIKEGGAAWHGSLAYETDYLLGTQNTHQGSAELGGPHVLLAPLLRWMGDDAPEVTFYANASVELSDGYLPSVNDLSGDRGLRSSVEDHVLGLDFRYGSFFYPLAKNDWRLTHKTVWQAGTNDKLSLTWTKNVGFSQNLGQPDIGDVVRETYRYPWNWAGNLDRSYTFSRDVNLLSLAWKRTLGLRTQSDARAWRYYSGQRKEVAGQSWNQYDSLSDTLRVDDPAFQDRPYFIDAGDAPDWRDRYVVVWGLANDWRHAWRNHHFDWGASAEYHEVQYLSIYTPTIVAGQGLGPRAEYDFFHVTPNVGNLYAQDQFEHEGMHVSLGLTYDYWFPGPQVERALANPESNQPYYTAELRRKFEAETRELFGHRFKDHLSPRVAVSFPVSEQAHVFFNYGHYSQRPPYFYVYSGSGRTTEAYPRKGNPALNPEISVSYEIGGEYQIDGATALRGNLFWKDVFDYPQSTQVDLPSGGSIFLYGNADYGRSQGIELSLHRSRRNFVSGSLAYTFSTAKGKASDPNQTKMLKQAGDDTRDLSLEEEYIAWNRPHKLTASLNLLVRESDAPPRWLGLPWPRDLNGRIFVLLRSGRAYTPYDADGNKIGVRNSRNGPYDSTCDLSLTKGFRLRGRRFLASFDVYNVFDYRTPLIFDWVTGEPYRAGVGSRTNLNQDPANFARAVDARVAAYVREYRRTHENQDPDPALVEEYRKTQAAALSPQYEYSYYYDENPAYFGQPRTFRLGITYEW